MKQAEPTEIEKIAIDNAPNCLICVNNYDFLISYKNKAANILLNQLLSPPRSFSDIFHPSEKDRISDLLVGDTNKQILYPDIDCKLNTTQELWVNVRMNKTAETYVFCLVDVIRNRKRISQIENSETLLNEAQEISKIGSFNLNLETGESYWSKEGYHIFGMHPEKDSSGFDSFYNIIHPEDIGMVKEKVEIAINTGAPFAFQFRIIMPDGKVKTILEEGRGILGADGKVKSVAGFYEDVSNVSQLQKSLATEQSRLNSILSSIEEVVFIIKITGPKHTDRIVEFISSNCKDFYGENAAAFYEHGPTLVFHRVHPEDMPILPAKIQELFSSKKQISFTLRIKECGSEKYNWIEHTFSPFVDKNNEVAGYNASARNINDKINQQKILEINEKRLLEAESIAKLGHWNWDINTNDISWSDEIYNIFGANKENTEISYPKFLSFVHPEDLAMVEAEISRSVNDGLTYSIQHRIITPANEIKYVWERGETHYDVNNKPVRMLGTVQDITEIKYLEEEVKKKEQQYKYFFENSLVGAFRANYIEKKVLQVNEKAVQIMGYKTREEFIDGFYKVNHHVESEGRELAYNELKTNNQLVKTVRFKKKNGDLFWGQFFSQIFPDKGEIEGIIIDITKQIEYEQQLLQSNTEKDLLLKEIHHRVKNNLQIIIGLIEIGLSNNSSDNRATINRIKSIAKIHDLLYRSPILGRMDIKTYLEKFISEFDTSYPDINIDFNFEVSSSLISTEQAIPIAIILNEVMMNIYKHAFKETHAGKVTIKLFEDDDVIFFEIRDNGKGLPVGYDINKTNSLGFTLISSLAKQLKAKLNIRSDNGTIFQLIFHKA